MRLVVVAAERMGERVNAAEPLLERRRAHGGRDHHVRARFDILAVLVGARQVFGDQLHALQRDAVGLRMVTGGAEGFEAMHERIDAGRRRDMRRQADGEFGIRDDQRRHDLRMENQFLFVAVFMHHDGAAADFRPRARCRRHGDHGGHAGFNHAQVIVALVHEIPQRARLADHQGDGLCRIKTRSAAEGDHAVMLTVFIRLHAVVDILAGRVRFDVRKYGGFKASRFQQRNRVFHDLVFLQPRIGDQQRFFHAEFFGVIGQFLDAAGAEQDAGGIIPGAGDVFRHDVHAFLRWKLFGRVRFSKPMTDIDAPRPVSFTPVQGRPGST